MKYITYLFTALIAVSCHGTSEPDADSNMGATPNDQEAALFSISHEQFEQANMALGEVSRREFSHRLSVNGYVKTTPEGLAELSPLIPSTIAKIYHSNGESVMKGDPLVSLKGMELIKLQEEYLQAVLELSMLKEEVERSELLLEEDVVSRKVHLEKLTAYKMKRSEKTSLEKQLELLNLPAERIAQGEIYSRSQILSPISGYIAASNLHLGRVVNPGELLLKVIDIKELRVHLQLFEKDIQLLQPGMKVELFDQNGGVVIGTGKVSYIGKQVDEQTRTVECIVTLNSQKHSLLNNMYVRGDVLYDAHEANAVPEGAIVDTEDVQYILKLQEDQGSVYRFKAIPVKVGISQDGWTEINESVEGTVLISGAFMFPFSS